MKSNNRIFVLTVEHTFWLGTLFYNFMDTFSAREVAEKLKAEKVEARCLSIRSAIGVNT